MSEAEIGVAGLVPVLKHKGDTTGTEWVPTTQFSVYWEYRDSLQPKPKAPEPLPRGGLAALKRRRDTLLAELGKVGGWHGPDYFIGRAFIERDPKLMSVYERFLTKENQTVTVVTVNSCLALLARMGCEDPTAALTESHLHAHSSLHDHVWEAEGLSGRDDDYLSGREPDYFFEYFFDAIVWLAFENLDRTQKLHELITRGCLDIRRILDQLPEIDSLHIALHDGVL